MTKRTLNGQPFRESAAGERRQESFRFVASEPEGRKIIK